MKKIVLASFFCFVTLLFGGFGAPAGFNGSDINNSQTQKIFIGEVNGDGRQDLITSNGFSGGLQANFSVMPRVCTVDLNLTGAVPNGTAGQTYSKTIYASGGIAPYNFTVSDLPSGLNFTTTADSVTISETPATGGEFNVSIGISDDNQFAELSEKNFVPQAANQLTQILPLQINFALTAASVLVSGRIFTANGRPVPVVTPVSVRRHDAHGAQSDVRLFPLRGNRSRTSGNHQRCFKTHTVRAANRFGFGRRNQFEFYGD